MSVSSDQLKRAENCAKQLEAQGYFHRAKTGDQRAASYFARLTAYTLNPGGHALDYGTLTKPAGGSNVDGYAEDAIVFGNDPTNLMNVVDLVNGAGAPGATIGAGDVKPRRAQDLWEQPKPLTRAEVEYLLEGSAPAFGVPTGGSAPAVPSYESMGGDEGGKKVTRLMEADYKTAEKPGLDGNSGAWQWRTAYDFLAGICKTVELSTAKHQPEWRASLNQERASIGKPPIVW